jgi:hypothetical protein
MAMFRAKKAQDKSRLQPHSITPIKSEWRNVLSMYVCEAFGTGYYPNEDFISIFRDLGVLEIRGGSGCLNRFSASISGASAMVRLPCGLAAR